MKVVLFSAAHGGFPEWVPLGGGASICRQLLHEWSAQARFPTVALDPCGMAKGPRQRDLVRFNEREYARFCRLFETDVTHRILQYPPESCVVLSNDVSEGPDFERLANAGYAIFTIYHVDVVDYIATIYLRGAVHPETLTRFYRQLARWRTAPLIPDILKLILAKQEASVRYSRGLIVPSEQMKKVLLACYPETAADKIHVVPWGIWPSLSTVNAADTAGLRERHGIAASVPILMTLSRLSPEKGQDLLLRALALWENQSDFPAEGLALFLCGEAAFMHGASFERRLRRLAARLRKTKVIFPGFLRGRDKAVLFKTADLYVFPSRHESYGLTLLEAFQSGLPVLTTATHGTEGLVQGHLGWRLPALSERQIPEALVKALREALSDRDRLARMGMDAAAFAAQRPFSQAAERVAALLQMG